MEEHRNTENHRINDEGKDTELNTRIEDAFIERYLMMDGESLEDARKRLKQQNNK